jgi:hypothetical protein
LEERPRPVQPLAQGRDVRPDPGPSPSEVGRAGADRRGPLVDRRHQHPGQSGGRRRTGGKSCSTSPSTTPSADPEAASAPSCT